MLDPQRVAAFCAVSFLLSVVPGPGVLFVVGRAPAHGRRVALASVLGNAVGGYTLAVAVALGVGSAVERSALLFTVVRLTGAGCLVVLGVLALWAARRDRAAPHGWRPEPSPGHPVRAGFLVGVGNPKSIVFLTSVLPQFVDPRAGHAVAQMLVLGLAGALLALATDGAWGLAASAARAWFGRSPRRIALMGGTGGLAMVGLGVSVAATGRAD
ncbi:LysE family translocator [Streptomyces sp. NPDC049881]|uniref:LysE family translocator n=1 Tax=Streptomyces sp. NPDC049881 TaxID=3155778 RepID=UPI003426C9B6